jgi:hypothetical protein
VTAEQYAADVERQAVALRAATVRDDATRTVTAPPVSPSITRTYTTPDGSVRVSVVAQGAALTRRSSLSVPAMLAAFAAVLVSMERDT